MGQQYLNNIWIGIVFVLRIYECVCFFCWENIWMGSFQTPEAPTYTFLPVVTSTPDIGLGLGCLAPLSTIFHYIKLRLNGR
jgi:hypothetical protein